MAFGIEVRVKLRGNNYQWQRVRPTGGAPYVWATEFEAETNMRLCYDADPTQVRVVAVEEPPNIGEGVQP